jgi:2-polyprenyl-3-methyl-5-hydroxy-6-metoxy-1,4-benzoquinol methylase
VLLPALVRRQLHVLACDIHPEATAAGAESFGLRGVHIFDARQGLASVADQSVSAILALDVLEHVPDVALLAAEFRRLLTPQGRLLCSLPTENLPYRLGRRLAGFSGAYHVQEGPREAVQGLTTHLKVRRIGQLYPFAPLFGFFEAHR